MISKLTTLSGVKVAAIIVAIFVLLEDLAGRGWQLCLADSYPEAANLRSPDLGDLDNVFL